MTTPPEPPTRGEIWLVHLDPTEGDEIAKKRPCIVMSGTSVGRLNLRIVVPITDWKDRYSVYPWMTRLEASEENGLTKLSAADAFQTRSVSLTRFVRYVGILPDDRVNRIATAIGLCIR